MAISGKYGQIEIPRIEKDEPVFILRAQDKLAVTGIILYQALAESYEAGVTQDLAAEIERFRNWKGKKKLPD